MIRIYESPTGIAGEYSYFKFLDSGIVDGSVTFAALPRDPISCLLTVTSPVDGYVLVVNMITGTLTRTGFDFILSAPTDSVNYELHYSIKY